MESSGTNFKNLKKILGQTLKSQVKKKKSHSLLNPFSKIYNYKEEPYK